MGVIGGLSFDKGIIPFFFLFLIILISFIPKVKCYIKVLLGAKAIFLFSICFLFGFVYLKMENQQYENLQKYLPKENAIQAVIISRMVEKDYFYQYEIKVEEMNHKKSNKKFILRIKKQKGKEMFLQYGDRIKVKAEYQRANGQRNFKGFDDAQYWKSKNIVGIFQTELSEIEVLQHRKQNSFFQFVYMVQEKMIKNVSKVLPKEHAELVIGFLLGDTTLLQEEIKEDFRSSNLSHMLAVSGSHVSYLVLIIGIAFKRIPLRKVYFFFP